MMKSTKDILLFSITGTKRKYFQKKSFPETQTNVKCTLSGPKLSQVSINKLTVEDRSRKKIFPSLSYCDTNNYKKEN